MQCEALLDTCHRMQGLRTLVLATRVLDEQMYQEWSRNYENAASSLEDREARIAAVSEKIGEHTAPLLALYAHRSCTTASMSSLAMPLRPMALDVLLLDCIPRCAHRVALALLEVPHHLGCCMPRHVRPDADLCCRSERDLELVGVTAIEDKLQEGVPQAISQLITAGIKVRPLPRLPACLGIQQPVPA